MKVLKNKEIEGGNFPQMFQYFVSKSTYNIRCSRRQCVDPLSGSGCGLVGVSWRPVCSLIPRHLTYQVSPLPPTGRKKTRLYSSRRDSGQRPVAPDTDGPTAALGNMSYHKLGCRYYLYGPASSN